MTFNGFRFALGCLALIPVIIWRSKAVPLADAAAKLPYQGSLAAGLFLFTAAGLQQIGLQYTSSANAGFMSVGIAFTLQVICQKRCPPAPAAIIMSLEAVFAAIAGYLVLSQTILSLTLLASASVSAGTWTYTAAGTLNTFTGNVLVSGGTLQAAINASGSSTALGNANSGSRASWMMSAVGGVR